MMNWTPKYCCFFKAHHHFPFNLTQMMDLDSAIIISAHYQWQIGISAMAGMIKMGGAVIT
jgi:hypothetical protein